MGNQSVAYYVGYYGAELLLGLCFVAAVIWLCKAIWRMIRPKKP